MTLEMKILIVINTVVRIVNTEWITRRSIANNYHVSCLGSSWSYDDLELVKKLTAGNKVNISVPLRDLIVGICQDYRWSHEDVDNILLALEA